MTALDSALHDSVRDLHAHLEATATHPVTETANRWLGEAEAVAADAVGIVEAAGRSTDASTDATADAAPRDALETRLEQVCELLAEVDGTGSNEADEHVRAARDRVDEILVEL